MPAATATESAEVRLFPPSSPHHDPLSRWSKPHVPKLTRSSGARVSRGTLKAPSCPSMTGIKATKQFWNELCAELEKISPGCTKVMKQDLVL